VADGAKELALQAETLRFSAFPPPAVAFEPAPLWERLLGAPPEEIQERPQVGLRNEFGKINENHLFVTQQTARFDIIYAMHPDKMALTGALVTIGAYEGTAQFLSSIVKNWLKIAPTVGRLAYAPNVVYPAPSHEASYELLQKLLPRLPIDPVNSAGMLWQINRPRRSKVLPELVINRLTKWSAIKTEHVQMPLQAKGEIVPSGSPIFAARIEIDVNTEPTIPIPAESLQSLFDELRTIAEELMQSGDIP
jgi:hypothetical protein